MICISAWHKIYFFLIYCILWNLWDSIALNHSSKSTCIEDALDRHVKLSFICLNAFCWWSISLRTVLICVKCCVFSQALRMIEFENDMIRRQTLQLGRLIIDFNVERGQHSIDLPLCLILDATLMASNALKKSASSVKRTNERNFRGLRLLEA